MLAAMSALLLAEITPPKFASMASSTEQSTLSIQCDGKPPYNEIDCKFIEVSLHVPDEAKIQTKLAEEKKQAATLSKKKIAEKIASTKKEICSALPKWRVEKESPPSRESDLREEVAHMEAACRCSTDDCFLQEILKIEENDLRTCNIRRQSWDLKLRRTSSHSWVSTHGPKGNCGNVEVSTLERDSKNDLWSFTWVRASSNKSDPLCAALETNKPSMWSWRTRRTFSVVTCRRFEID